MPLTMTYVDHLKLTKGCNSSITHFLMSYTSHRAGNTEIKVKSSFHPLALLGVGVGVTLLLL